MPDAQTPGGMGSGSGLTKSCLNGWLHYPSYDTLTEALVKAKRGAAIVTLLEASAPSTSSRTLP